MRNLVPDLKRLRQFLVKDYRDAFLETTVRAGVAYQIRAIREKIGLSQLEFAEKTGKKQSTISRLESTEYGRVSVQTLLDIAASNDLALLVRFVDYPTFFWFADRMSSRQLQSETINESLSRATEVSGLPFVRRSNDLFAVLRKSEGQPSPPHRMDPLNKLTSETSRDSQRLFARVGRGSSERSARIGPLNFLTESGGQN